MSSYNRITLNDMHLKHINDDIRVQEALPVKRDPAFAMAIAAERVREYERNRTSVSGRPALRPA